MPFGGIPITQFPAPTMRCERTGNPCGTDTLAAGDKCCATCQRWAARYDLPKAMAARGTRVSPLDRLIVPGLKLNRFGS
jgi:hypothetical protein